MTNIRVFVTLLVCVQSVFLLADGWTAYVERRRSPAQLLRLSAFVLGMALLYFAVQLALSSAVPDFHTLLTTMARWTGGVQDSEPAEVSWPAAIVLFLASYVLGTLFDYLVHRFVLHGRLFAIHENHHLPTVVSNLMPGIAARPFVAIPNFLINAASAAVLFVIVRLTGAPALVGAFEQLALPLVLVFAFIACASHSSFLRRYDVVDRVFRALAIVTPREHLVHHAADIQGNYGNFTMVWDRLFGTYVPPAGVAARLGLPYDQDFLGSLTGGLVKVPRGARAYFAVDAVCFIGLDTADPDRQNVRTSYD